MQADDTSDNDVPIDPDPKVDLISSLRKENLYLQTKIGELQAKIQNFTLLNEKNKNLTEKLKKSNSKIADMKYRLQISIIQNQENQNKNTIERSAQNQFYVNETNKLKNTIEQFINKNNTLSLENKQLKEKIDYLSNKHDVDLSFIRNKNEILLSSARSFFQINFNSIDQLKEYLSRNSLPPVAFPEKDKTIETQLLLINDLRKKYRAMKKEYASLLNKKKSEIDQLNQKVQSQQLVINNLNSQIEQKIDFFTKKISKIKTKIPKQKNLHKFTSTSISIVPDPQQMHYFLTEKEKINSNSCSSKLIKDLNETILQLQEENKKIQNELFNNQIQTQKLKAENNLKQDQITKYCIKLKSLKKEYELKLKYSDDKIKELQISNKIPDPFTENLISSAKTKIHQQKESIIYKDSQLSKFTREIDQLKSIISQQKIEIVRLKAELETHTENSLIQHISEIPQNYALPIQDKEVPNCFIFNYAEINPKLKQFLKPIIESQSLSAESKLQIAIRKIDSFYMPKVEKKRKYKEINLSIGNFISEIFQLLIGRHFDVENLSKNNELQSQAIEAIKENKRQLENLQGNNMTQNNEITLLKKKIARLKEKLASCSNQHKKIESLKCDFDYIVCENEKLKDENTDLGRKLDLLKNENAELYSVLEHEKNHIIQIKKEQTSSIGEYEELLKKMKKKCCDQRETIKCLSGCYC